MIPDLVLNVHLALLVVALVLLLLCWALLEWMLCTIGLVAGTPLMLAATSAPCCGLGGHQLP